MTKANMWEDERGTAFAEALVVVPVLFATLAGVVAVQSMYGAKLEAKARGRRAAWLHSTSADCRAHTCSDGRCDLIEAELRAEGLDSLGSTQSSGSSLRSFVGSMGTFLRLRTAHGLGVATTPIPAVFGSPTTTQHGTMVLACNTTGGNLAPDQSVLERACATELRDTEYANEVCR